MTLVPQWPQKGRDASTGFAHLGHVFVDAMGDTRVGGIISPPDPTAAPGMGVSGLGGALTTAADEPAE